MSRVNPILYLGNKNYSSWSLRPWLVLKWGAIPFDEVVIRLGGEGYGRGEIATVLAVSPSGRVPALALGATTIWDSLAIAEWAAEAVPRLWPEDPEARAICRAVTAEMHSGFGAMRHDLPMNIRRRTTPREWGEETRRDLARVERIWTTTRARYGAGGPFLFGGRTIADAFYTPVATRLRTYGVPLSSVAADYCAAVLAESAFREWEVAAERETWTIAGTDDA